MRGHLQHRSGDSWRLKVYLGRSADGRKRYLERTVHGTRRDAERELSRLVVEVDDGRHAAAAPMLFDELLDRWLEVKRASVAPRTIESYEWVARKYLRPRLGSRKLASLRTMDLDDVYVELGASGLSARTVRICHTVVHQALDQGRRWGLVAQNPATEATPPRHIRKEVTPPTLEQVLLLLDTAYDEDPEFGTFLWVKSATGCRRGEVCALRWSDLDLERPELFVRRAITQVGRELIEGDTLRGRLDDEGHLAPAEAARIGFTRAVVPAGSLTEGAASRAIATASSTHLSNSALLTSLVGANPQAPSTSTRRPADRPDPVLTRSVSPS